MELNESWNFDGVICVGEGPYIRVDFQDGKLIFGLLRYAKRAPGPKSVDCRDLKASDYNCYVRIDSNIF